MTRSRTASLRAPLLGLIATLALGVALAGCGSGDEAPVPAAAPLNPSGKPRNEQEASTQQAQVQAGQQLDSAMSDAARAEAEAKAKTGGK